jgi:hypothetical protein
MLNIYILDKTRENNKIFFFLLGIINGLCFYFYTGARAIPIFTLLFTVIYFKELDRKKIIYFFFGLILSLLPSVLFFINPIGEFFAREINTTFINSSSLTLYEFVQNRYLPNLLSSLAILFFGNDQSAYYFSKPLLDLISVMLLIFSLLSLFKNRFLLFLASTIIATLLLVSLTDNAALSSRLTVIIPSVYLIVSIGAFQVIKMFKKIFYLNKIKRIVILTIVAVLILNNLYIYFDPKNDLDRPIGALEAIAVTQKDLNIKKLTFFSIAQSANNIYKDRSSYAQVLTVANNKKVNYLPIQDLTLKVLENNKANVLVLNFEDTNFTLSKIIRDTNKINKLHYTYYISKKCDRCDNGVIALRIENYN